MKHEHFPRAARSRAGAVACLGIAAGLNIALVAPAHAYPTSISIPGYSPSGGTLVSSDFGRLLQGAARIEGTVSTAGKAITVGSVMRTASGAGRVVATACFLHPVGCAAVVGTGAVALWLLQSKLSQDENGVYQQGYTETTEGFCWYATGNAATQSPCFPSSGQAALAWRQANPAGIVYTHTELISVSADGNTSCDRVFGKRPPDTVTVYSNSTCSNKRVGQTVEEKKRLAVQEDFDVHADAVPLPDDAANESPVPVPVDAPEIEETFEPLSDPYPGPDPLTGPWKQDGVKIEGKPETANPTDVEATPVTRDVDNPNTPEDETPDPDGGGTPDTPKEDVCQLHPNSVMCTDLGQAPSDEVPKATINVSWAAESLGLPAGCPEPIIVQGHTISYQSACDAMVTIRPVVILIAGLMALLIVMAAVRGGS